MRSVWVFCALLLFLVGCGGSPATPSSSAATSLPTLQPGAYYFTISEGSGTTTVGGSAFTTSMCLGVGSFPTFVQVPVTVTVNGANWEAVALNGSLRVRLSASAAGASGTMQGNAQDGTGAFSLSVEGSEPAGISGAVTGDHTASGTVEGNITLAGPQGYGGCSPANWSLTSR